jgi:hypothetical protein
VGCCGLNFHTANVVAVCSASVEMISKGKTFAAYLPLCGGESDFDELVVAQATAKHLKSQERGSVRCSPTELCPSPGKSEV